MTPTNKDNSVLFSLNELMNIERDRLEQEEQAAQRKLAEDRARVEAQKALAVKQEQERIAAVEQAQRAEQLRRQEQEERRVREREESELRVRLETEAKAKAETLARQLAHEQQMAALNAVQQKAKTSRIFAGVVVTLALAVGVVGVFAQKHFAAQDQARNEAAARELQAVQARADQQAALDRAETQRALDRANQAAQRAADLQRQTQTLLSNNAAQRPTVAPVTRPRVITRPRPNHNNSLQIDTNSIERFDRFGD